MTRRNRFQWVLLFNFNKKYFRTKLHLEIIVVLTVGTNAVARINASTRVIAVWMPNNQTVNSQSWGYYRTTVDYIESKTGYNFMSNVSSSIQSVIESRVDSGPTS